MIPNNDSERDITVHGETSTQELQETANSSKRNHLDIQVIHDRPGGPDDASPVYAKPDKKKPCETRKSSTHDRDQRIDSKVRFESDGKICAELLMDDKDVAQQSEEALYALPIKPGVRFSADDNLIPHYKATTVKCNEELKPNDAEPSLVSKSPATISTAHSSMIDNRSDIINCRGPLRDTPPEEKTICSSERPNLGMDHQNALEPLRNITEDPVEDTYAKPFKASRGDVNVDMDRQNASEPLRNITEDPVEDIYAKPFKARRVDDVMSGNKSETQKTKDSERCLSSVDGDYATLPEARASDDHQPHVGPLHNAPSGNISREVVTMIMIVGDADSSRSPLQDVAITSHDPRNEIVTSSKNNVVRVSGRQPEDNLPTIIESVVESEDSEAPVRRQQAPELIYAKPMKKKAVDTVEAEVGESNEDKLPTNHSDAESEDSAAAPAHRQQAPELIYAKPMKKKAEDTVEAAVGELNVSSGGDGIKAGSSSYGDTYATVCETKKPDALNATCDVKSPTRVVRNAGYEEVHFDQILPPFKSQQCTPSAYTITQASSQLDNIIDNQDSPDDESREINMESAYSVTRVQTTRMSKTPTDDVTMATATTSDEATSKQPKSQSESCYWETNLVQPNDQPSVMAARGHRSIPRRSSRRCYVDEEPMVELGTPGVKRPCIIQVHGAPPTPIDIPSMEHVVEDTFNQHQ